MTDANATAADSATARSLAQRRIAIIGAGPAGLMAAERLAKAGHAVTVFERMPSPARKFLMAGRGGLNLTHSEDFERLAARYGDAAPPLRPALEAFGPQMLRDWCEGLGEATFVGSSGRVFPASFKASPLLRAWLRRLGDLGVEFRLRHRWTGWDGGSLTFDTPDGTVRAVADATILAAGGASWPRLGSDGTWSAPLQALGAVVTPLEPANCGVAISWSAHLLIRFEGAPLKRIALAIGDHRARGEAVITRTGLEGGAVYALSGRIREALAGGGATALMLDLRPDLDIAALAARLKGDRGGQSLASVLRKRAALAPAAVALLRESEGVQGPLAPLDADALAARIKGLALPVIALAAIDRAISTAGGVAWSEIDASFMLHRRPGVFVAGEMIDWEAPTGGYLLQACLATGAAAATGAIAWLHRDRPPHATVDAAPEPGAPAVRAPILSAPILSAPEVSVPEVSVP